MIKESKNKTSIASLSKNNNKNHSAVGDSNNHSITSSTRHSHNSSLSLSSSSYNSQMSALMLAEEALAPPTIHIYSKKEGRRDKTLILLPLLDDLPLDEFVSLLKRTFHCSAGIVDLKKALPTASRGTAAASSALTTTSTSSAGHDDNVKGQAISMTGNHCVAVKRLLASRGVYESCDIHIHG